MLLSYIYFCLGEVYFTFIIIITTVHIFYVIVYYFRNITNILIINSLINAKGKEFTIKLSITSSVFELKISIIQTSNDSIFNNL